MFRTVHARLFSSSRQLAGEEHTTSRNPHWCNACRAIQLILTNLNRSSSAATFPFDRTPAPVATRLRLNALLLDCLVVCVLFGLLAIDAPAVQFLLQLALNFKQRRLQRPVARLPSAWVGASAIASGARVATHRESPRGMESLTLC